MIGPAEIEDILLDLADAERARPRDDVDPAAAHRWGIEASASRTDADRVTVLLDGKPQSRVHSV